MPTHNHALSSLANKVSEYSNRPVNLSLAMSIVSLYLRDNHLDRFAQFLAVLGISEPEHAHDIYKIVNDNIGSLEKSLKLNQPHATNAVANSLSARLSAPQSDPAIAQNEASDPSQYDVDHATIAQVAPITFKKSVKDFTSKRKTDRTALYEDELEDLGNKPVANSQIPMDELDFDEVETLTAKTAPISFKRIKKEDAARIRGDVQISQDISSIEHDPGAMPLISLDPRTDHKKASSSSEIAQCSTSPVSATFPPAKATDESFDLDMARMGEDVEFDREWYNNDELGHALDDAIDSAEVSTVSKRESKSNRSHSLANQNGGFYDPNNGEYVDFDHLNSEDTLSRIPILNHTFVPPFLEASKQYLQFQLGGGGSGSIKSIGPTVDPIKDPASDLANAARSGSDFVKERKSRRERAQHAKARSDIVGTNMGNVLAQEKGDSAQKIESNTESYQEDHDATEIAAQRNSLPAFAVKNDLIRIISENQVTIVIGETGSGKTTQLTQFLYEKGFCENLASNGSRRMIGCTQPRRVAAMLVAKRVSEEMGCVLGKEVGYSIRFEDRTDYQTTMIKYMTEGVLLREILVDPLLENYSCIIMDEAHERSLNTDVLLGLFKRVLARRKDLKLIVTSATMNAERFSTFFSDAPQFTIPGRTFPVDVMFSRSGHRDYVEAAVKQIMTIHLQSWTTDGESDGDILVFMTGQEDIEATCDLLREKLDMLEGPPPLDILPIYSALPADVQKRIFAKKSGIRRKVVVATNIAETSLTVDGIKYVVDCGLVKLKVYNPKLGMDTLQVIPISLANSQQRSGRAGRTGPGVAYRLYTERATEIDQMYRQPIPEIQRTNLSNVMLLLKSLKIENIDTFNFLDPPPQDLLNCSLYELWAIDALDNLGRLTRLGEEMASFPMEPLLSRAILLSCRPEFHCSNELVTIVALLSVPPIFYRPKERADEADLARERFAVSESDHLTLLNVYDQWETSAKKNKHNFGRMNAWCSRNFVQLKSLARARDIKEQLLLILRKKNMPVVRARSDNDIRKCLAASFYQQLAKLVKNSVHGSPEFINMRHQYMKMYLHPTSSLNGSSLSTNYVIYHDLILTTKEYMSCVTTVEPIWLLEFGFKFYDVAPQYRQQVDALAEKPLITRAKMQKELETDAAALNERRINDECAKEQSSVLQINKTRKFKTRRAF